MANSEFEYVRKHEQWDGLAPDNWIVVRIDGRGFSKFTKRHGFAKPNDRRGIDLMNAAAQQVVSQALDIVVAYGQSDEYSFVFHQNSTLFDRRASKLATMIASTFSVEYVLQWPLFFPDTPLQRPFPTFDGRTVLYPKRRILRDYLSWRQADCHVNNLFNTTFWALVQQGGMRTDEAEQELKGTFSSDKNEILFSRFGINYNNEEQVYRKGTVIYRAVGAVQGSDVTPASASAPAPTVEGQAEMAIESSIDADPVDSSTQNRACSRPASKPVGQMSKTRIEKERKRRMKATINVEHVDIIRDAFWEQHPWLLED